MNFLQICQRLRQETFVTGTGPSTVLSQTGELRRIVDWAAATWDEIQLLNPSWRWMRSTFSVNTVAADDTYAYGDCTDGLTAVAITRFSHWWPFDDSGSYNVKIYKQADGVGAERWMPYLPWANFRALYRIGTQNNGQPAHFTIDPQDNLVLGPKPDDVYVVSGEFQRGPVALAADADTPDMPAKYHMLIVYRAMEKYGAGKVAVEVFNRAVREGERLLRALELNQLPLMPMAPPLA